MFDTELLLWTLGTLTVAILQCLKEGLRGSWYFFLGAVIFAFFYLRRMAKKYGYPEEDKDAEDAY